MNDTVTGVILSGGRSRRFGSDKALYLLEGTPMIKRVYTTVSKVVTPVFISVNSGETMYSIPVRHIVDKFPDAGPLAGIYTALLSAPTDWILVVAVDLPYVTTQDLQKLLDARASSLDAVVATSEERMQPLAGCYHKRISSMVRQRLKNKHYAVTACLENMTFKAVPLDPRSLSNLNTPPDKAD